MHHFKCSIIGTSYVIVSALITLAVVQPSKVGRILGGIKTTIDDLPYQVSVQNNGIHICGGSIISSTRVLTAAYCTVNSNANSLSVRAGSNFRGIYGIVANVKNICTHPQYKPLINDNDVSVLILLTPLNFTNEIQPISLVYPGTSVSTGFPAIVSGWGTTTSQSGSLNIRLKKVDVPKISQSDCKRAYENYGIIITDSMTCYGLSNDSKGFCHGDYGGPLAIGRIQVGVASWGASCSELGKPEVYVDLAKPIIRNHINSC